MLNPRKRQCLQNKYIFERQEFLRMEPPPLQLALLYTINGQSRVHKLDVKFCMI
jgi:hypothetical protein